IAVARCLERVRTSPPAIQRIEIHNSLGKIAAGVEYLERPYNRRNSRNRWYTESCQIHLLGKVAGTGSNVRKQTAAGREARSLRLPLALMGKQQSQVVAQTALDGVL